MFVEEANCQTCNKKFIKKHYRHRFCRRKCFLIYRYKNTLSNHLAGYTCENCGAKVTLGFDPKEQYTLWAHFRCPICHISPSKIDPNIHASVISGLTFRYVVYDITCKD